MVEAKLKLARAVELKLRELGTYDLVEKETGISRSTLFRLKNGDWIRPGSAIRAAANILHVELQHERDPRDCSAVLSVIGEIWDGSDAHAYLLAEALKKIHQLSKFTVGATQ